VVLPRIGDAGADRRVAAAVLAAAAAIFALTFAFDEVPAALMQGLGAALFPRLVLAVIALLALALAWHGGGARLAPVPRAVWATAAALAAAALAIPLIGMLAAGFVVTVGLGRMWGERRLRLLLAAAAAMTAALWLVFVRLLGVALPRGALGELLLG
jgi:hypothetical protein